MKKKTSLLFGILLVIIAISVIYQSRTFPPFIMSGKKLAGPGFFPTLLSYGLIVTGFYEILLALRAGKLSERSSLSDYLKDWGNQNVLIIIGSLFLYVILLEKMGYIITTFLFSSLLMIRMKTGWIKGTVVSAIVVFLIMVLFVKLFRIQLPQGFLDISL